MTDETKTPETTKAPKRPYKKTVAKKACDICGKKYSPQGMTSHMRSHQRELALQHSDESPKIVQAEDFASRGDFMIVTRVRNGEIAHVSINKAV